MPPERPYRWPSLFLLGLALLFQSCAKPTEEPPVEDQSALLEAWEDERIQVVYRERYEKAFRLLEGMKGKDAGQELAEIEIPVDSVHDMFFDGILRAWTGDNRGAVERLSQAARLSGRPLRDPMLKQKAETWHLNPDYIESAEFLSNDILYLQRCVLLQSVADQIVAGCRSPSEKVSRILDWVFRNVGFFEPVEIGPRPADILIRGYGLCDRQAWVMALLCQRVGVPAGLALLAQDVEGFALHTMCEVLVGGRWLLCDPTQGTVVKVDGRPVTLEHIERLLQERQDDPEFQEEYGRFRKPTIGVACIADGTFPRFALLEPYLRAISPRVKVHHDLAKGLEMTSGFSIYGDRKRDFVVGVWDYPFHVLASYTQKDYLEKRAKDMQRAERYTGPRVLQLIGQPEQALLSYFHTAQQLDPAARQDTDYFSALCKFDLKRYPEAAQAFSLYLRSYPQGLWRTGATYHLAQCKEKLDDPSEAIRLYGQLQDVGLARLHLQRLTAPEKTETPVEPPPSGAEL